MASYNMHMVCGLHQTIVDFLCKCMRTTLCTFRIHPVKNKTWGTRGWWHTYHMETAAVYSGRCQKTPENRKIHRLATRQFKSGVFYTRPHIKQWFRHGSPIYSQTYGGIFLTASQTYCKLVSSSSGVNKFRKIKEGGFGMSNTAP